MEDPIWRPYIRFPVKIRDSGLVNVKNITRVFEANYSEFDYKSKVSNGKSDIAISYLTFL